MKNKTLIYECNCIHCQQKLNQINNSKTILGQINFKKKVGIVSLLNSLRFSTFFLKYFCFKNLLFSNKKIKFYDL